MNGTENFVMTGSSNPRTEQLDWLSEVASAVSKGTLSRQVPPQNLNAINSLTSSAHNAGNNSPTLFLSNAGTVFPPSAVLTRNLDANSMRMFAPPFQAERTRQVQPASAPVGGAGTTLYYSQAPRSTPYSNFFQATYSSPMTFASTTAPVASTTAGPSDTQRSYLQVDNYPPVIGVQTIGSSNLPCSLGYLQHPPLASSSANPNSVGPNRVFQQGRSILISRSPEGMIVHSPKDREPTHVRIQLSPAFAQELDDATQRKSYSSADSVRIASSCSPVIDTAMHDFSLLREQRTSPSHMGYRMPTGKEGSLKHRILRPPSINIVDPPPSLISDAPLSAPPIRSHREGGVGGGGGGGHGPQYTYTFSGDPRATFAQFFGTDNPFESFFNMGGMGLGNHGGPATMFYGDDDMDVDGDPFSHFGARVGSNPFRSQSFTAGSPNISRAKPKGQDPPLEHDLYVTLEDIAKGCTKKMKISRKVLNPDGRSTKREEKVLSINVKPGWKAGTKITFQKEGDQNPNSIPADISFIIRDKPHAVFKREGNDIRYTAKVSLKEALCGTKAEIPTLFGEKKMLRITDIVKPNFVHRLKGYGLPFPKDPVKKGDLIVAFDIKFPEYLSESAKATLKEILPNQ